MRQMFRVLDDGSGGAIECNVEDLATMKQQRDLAYTGHPRQIGGRGRGVQPRAVPGRSNRPGRPSPQR